MRKKLVRGYCLFCRQGDLMVFWAGPVTMDNMTAPAFMCEPCGGHMATYLKWYLQQRDNRPAC